jgi:membrane-associated phospholipid phosphatase
MNKRKLFLIVCCFLAFQSGINAQNDSVYHADFSKNYFKSYMLDTRDLILSPFKWNKWEWTGFAAFAGCSYFIMKNDLEIYEFFMKQKTDNTDRLSTLFLEPWGSGVYSMPLMALFYSHGLIFKNNRSKKTALLGIKAYLLTGIAVNIPKIILNRQRPYHGDEPNPNNWMGPFAKTHYKSYPSGHTTSVFALATILACEYKSTIWVPVLSYSIAGLSALSRINDTKHWFSDVLGGAVFGWSMAKLIHSANNWKLSFSPYSNGYSSGVFFSFPVGQKKPEAEFLLPPAN